MTFCLDNKGFFMYEKCCLAEQKTSTSINFSHYSTLFVVYVNWTNNIAKYRWIKNKSVKLPNQHLKLIIIFQHTMIYISVITFHYLTCKLNIFANKKCICLNNVNMKINVWQNSKLTRSSINFILWYDI